MGNDLVEIPGHVVNRPTVLVANSSGGLIILWAGVQKPVLVLGVAEDGKQTDRY